MHDGYVLVVIDEISIGFLGVFLHFQFVRVSDLDPFTPNFDTIFKDSNRLFKVLDLLTIIKHL